MRLGNTTFGWWVVAGWILLPAAMGLAQAPQAPGQPAATPAPAGAKTPESPQPALGPAVEARQLDTFLLRDSNGKLVPVLGMTFEEFEKLLQLRKGLIAPPAPGFSLDALSITGSVAGGVADLQATLTIRTRDEGWVRVPLGMKNLVLRQPPRYEGPGEHFLAYDETAGEYIAWLKGSSDQPHVLTLQASCSLSTVGEETRLALPLPRATESSLRLSSSGPRLEALLLKGDGIASAQSKGADQQELAVLGPAGDFQLGWRKARDTTASGPALFDASGEIVVKVESESRISADARLRVRSLSAPLEVFQVRLPAGMELVPSSPTGYTLTAITAPAAGAAVQPQVVEVRLDRATTQTTEIRLLATSSSAAEPIANLTPARFEVVGAVRQRGTIDFTVEGEWQLDWTEDATVRRLDIAADAASAKLAARYEYFRQPCGLVLRVAARPSRVTVEPTHTVYVEPRQVRVETTLKYRLRGARAEGLRFRLGDLKFDRLSPEDLLAAPEPAGTDGLLHIPFQQGVALPAELELKLQTHRTLVEGTEQISLVLPRPEADTVAPATVIVLAADNVELAPQVGQLQGLSADTASLPPTMAARQQPPLVYRDLGGGEPATFVAGLKIRTRSTIAEAKATVRVNRQELQIEQRLEYRISHEPQRSFVLAGPRGVAPSAGVQVWLGAEPLGVTPLVDQPTSSASTQRWQFSTPTDKIGVLQVAVRYTLALPRWDGQKPLPVVIPLILPLNEAHYQFGGQQISFELAEGMQIEPDVTGVDEFSRPTAVAGADAAFTWSKAASTTRWVLQPAQAATSSRVVCQQAWVQSWLTRELREDRAVFRLTTSGDAVRVRLPAGAALGSAQAAVDGQVANATPREPLQLRVEIPPAARGRPCVVEVWYSLPPPPRRGGILAGGLRPATIDEASPPRRVYWQLSLPTDDYLLMTPGELTSEMTWAGDDWLAGPAPVLDQRRLEQWIGGSRQDPLPAGANTYLFGALARNPRFDLVVAGRRTLLAGASGLALGVGLLLLYVPWLRKATSLAVVALGLIVLALALPEAALVVGRAALLGLLVVASVAAWRWLASGQPVWSPPTPSTITAPAEFSAPSTTLPPRAMRVPPLTTATAPAALATGDSRP